MAYGTKNFEEAQPIDARLRLTALADAGRARGHAAGRLVHRMEEAGRAAPPSLS